MYSTENTWKTVFITAVVFRTGFFFTASLGAGGVVWFWFVWLVGFFLNCLLSFLSEANTVENEPKVAVEDWSEDDVSAWLCAQGLADFVGLFKMNNIDGKELLNLTKESLANDLKIGKSIEIQIVFSL